MANPQLTARRFRSRETDYVLIEDKSGVGFYRLQSMEQAEALYRDLKLMFGGK